MTKNVIVLDEFGNQLGLTYSKRARGLVKNGRAEYADGCENKIRLLSAHVPTYKMEESIMSNVINFNAKEFKFDETCKEQAGARMFITDRLGNNVEQFEIGDSDGTYTQIFCEKQLEKNTDYIFRFAMTGGYNYTNNAVSQFIVISRSKEGDLSKDWNERSVYPLDKSRYKPVLSKYTQDELLRVYEIPFNSGETGICRFVFAAQYATANIMPAYHLEEYAELEDISYEQWFNNYKEKNICDTYDFGNLNLEGAIIPSATLEMILSKAGTMSNINLTRAVIDNDNE
jgi:hypothetical protein